MSSSLFMHRFGKTKSLTKKSTKKYLEVALYRRLFKDGGTEVSVRQNLNLFLKSRKKAYKWEVDHTLKILRNRKRYAPALKLSETMAERGMNKTVSDQAVHLDLIAKARGISAAEAYFVDLPEQSKNHYTYGALLNHYCKELMTDKAESMFEKMKEWNLNLTSLHYNSILTLYEKTGQPERIPEIIRDMKTAEVKPDVFTYNIWMRVVAAMNDISGVERVIDEIKRDEGVSEDWTTYSNLASIYVNAGLTSKAEKALKELEKKNTYKNLSAFQHLITLYGKTGNLVEVYRVWRSLRLAFPKTANISYLNMIQVLVKLNDLPGAEKCFREWVSGCSSYDIRIANALIGAYAKAGLFEKAEELKELSRRRGAKPNAKTWEIFLNYHLEKGDIVSAVNCIDNAISTGRANGEKWVPSSTVVQKFMTHFESSKDVDAAEGFVQILEKVEDNVGVEVLESLIRIYAAAGKTTPVVRRRVKMENVELSNEGKTLLETISTT
ncbi:pentatricopeptide repeat-containing protein At1g60770 [Cynara cardunculus var. scolymus]|uniref:Pentatricopeptide repeat-containing protein n=1 Tax=Cynara cardunculus var. scolymus TaxID=59895 RepID=A0A103YAS8_CYNCS|nr:pentatricopeptide repeat-containing protein At1g60770 [Cynara cardunculus var. scolymus]KVI05669.1 Pentatricopeptide repeat-containing protein [Cynara cardunculus var. scolymus]